MTNALRHSIVKTMGVCDMSSTIASERKIMITVGGATVRASLNDTDAAARIWNALPIDASANTWGDEIYFSIPVEVEEEDGRDVVDLGDLGYWPPGNAFCIFYGRTPLSRGDEIRPASPVTVIGRVDGSLAAFKQASPGDSVRIDRV